MKIGPHDVPLETALPLRLGDWKALEALGVTPQELAGGSISMTRLAALVYYVARKANPSVSETDVDAMTLDDVTEAFRQIGAAEGARASRPT
jgi:hypothetical protein